MYSKYPIFIWFLSDPNISLLLCLQDILNDNIRPADKETIIYWREAIIEKVFVGK